MGRDKCNPTRQQEAVHSLHEMLYERNWKIEKLKNDKGHKLLLNAFKGDVTKRNKATRSCSLTPRDVIWTIERLLLGIFQFFKLSNAFLFVFVLPRLQFCICSRELFLDVSFSIFNLFEVFLEGVVVSFEILESVYGFRFSLPIQTNNHEQNTSTSKQRQYKLSGNNR